MKRSNYVRETDERIIIDLPTVGLRIQKDTGDISIIPRQLKTSRTHDKILRELAVSMVLKGIEKIRVDLKDFEPNDPSLRLTAGNRRYDIVFCYNGKTYQGELKPPGNVWECRTWLQLNEMARTAENLILIVPLGDVEKAEEFRQEDKSLWKMKVFSYESLLKKISGGQVL